MLHYRPASLVVTLLSGAGQVIRRETRAFLAGNEVDENSESEAKHLVNLLGH